VSQRENVIQHDILQYLRGRKDTYVLNVGGGASTAKGTSDLLLCFMGRFVALEVKRPDGSYGLTKPQQMRLEAVRRAGGIGTTVTSLDEVVKLIKGLEAENH
jgi:hypothetical protein